MGKNVDQENTLRNKMEFKNVALCRGGVNVLGRMVVRRENMGR